MIPVDNHLPEVRRLTALGWGNRRIGTKLGIGKDAALRLMKKIQLEQARQAVPAANHSAVLVTRADWASEITLTWRKSAECIIETGRLVARAKEALPHGEFIAMVESELPFKRRMAQMLMEIAANPRMADAQFVALLPPNLTAIHQIHKLPDEAIEARVADGTIRPDMQTRDIAATVKKQRRATRERVLGELQSALPQKKYGVILADPEWRFEPWSRETGMDRSADNHYPTSVTEVIAARDVASIAAPDCVLFLWATAPMILHAAAVMAAWGFDYKSHAVWIKDTIGTGYWFRNGHELLLVGTKGNVPAPAPGTQFNSWFEVGKGQHSEKPERALEMIEQYFPTLPKIELNRRGPARLGWDAWGFEADANTDSRDNRMVDRTVTPADA